MRELRAEVSNFSIAFTGDFDDEDPLVAIGVITRIPWWRSA
jgi:hypothetical protein